MKKLLVILFSILLMASVAYGAVLVGVTSEANGWKTGPGVTCSSTTATSVLAANSTRLSFTIVNPSDDYSVWMSSYAATSTSQCIEIQHNNSYYKDINPWLGPIFVLTDPGQTPIKVSFDETWR